MTARKPIQARHLKPKWLVEEDDEVVIQNQAGGISVDMVGIALENGQFEVDQSPEFKQWDCRCRSNKK